MKVLDMIGRSNELFVNDVLINSKKLNEIINVSTFLILGGAGSIGKAVTKEIFKRNPSKLHVVDISENNLVELVRDLRSSYGYINGDFKTYALDIGSLEYDCFIDNDGKYDYVLNLSALKHVRSEKDPYTLMRMIDVNIFNTDKTLKQSIKNNSKKYFCVSTDKAANPVNMMGASKRIMEMFLTRRSNEISISTARFANVAFSDGSLLNGFKLRLSKNQPIVAPNDIKRYFVSEKEAGILCLMSCIFGNNRDIFFPKLSDALHLISFVDIAKFFLKENGYKPFLCKSEDEARKLSNTLPSKGMWPCFFSKSNTSGEKSFEEFYTKNEKLDLQKFSDLGIIKNILNKDFNKILKFEKEIIKMRSKKKWIKKDLINLFNYMIPKFNHMEKENYLDSKM